MTARETRWGGLMLVIWLAGCAATPEPAIVPDKIIPQMTLPTEPKPLLKRTVTTRWSFDAADDHCRATMTGAGASLEAAVTRSGGATIALRATELTRLRRGSVVPMRLAGSAGAWTASGVVGRGIAVSKSPMDEDAAGRILVLLSGGTVQAGLPRMNLPTLAIPSAGARGTTWFGCVRKQLLP